MRRNEKSNSASWYLIINYREIWTWEKFLAHRRQPSMGWSRCLYWKKWTAPYHFHNHRFNNHLRSFLAMTNLKRNFYVYLTVCKKVRLIGVQTRSLLPNSLKTEIVMTMNLREWRHFFVLRTSESAHPQMREISIPLLKYFQKKIPLIFDDI